MGVFLVMEFAAILWIGGLNSILVSELEVIVFLGLCFPMLSLCIYPHPSSRKVIDKRGFGGWLQQPLQVPAFVNLSTLKGEFGTSLQVGDGLHNSRGGDGAHTPS